MASLNITEVMKTDNDVKQLLENWELIDPPKSEIAKMILKDAEGINSGIQVRIMYGGLMFSVEGNDVGGVFLRKNHVSLEFSSGYLLTDSGNFLEGTGKFRRHLKLRTTEDVETKKVKEYFRQILQGELS